MPVIKKYYPAAPGMRPVLKECYEVNDKAEKNGSYQSWYLSGKEHTIATFLKDQPIGRWIEKHPNGRTAVEKHYDTAGTGCLDGSYKKFWADGTCQLCGFYIENKENGIFMSWDADGSLRARDNYIMGIRQVKRTDGGPDIIRRSTLRLSRDKTNHRS